MTTKHLPRVAALALLPFAALCGCAGNDAGPNAGETDAVGPESLWGWTQNPSLARDAGSWDVRAFCWTIGGDCPDDPQRSVAEWPDDRNVYLRAEDDDTENLGTVVAALTQGVDFGGHVHGEALARIRTGDVEEAAILLARSEASATACSGIGASGNIINLWLRHPGSGARWVTDFYFETTGLNADFGERAGPHNALVAQQKGVDWYAYQVEMESLPEYWERSTDAEGIESWVIDLKALLDRGSAFSKRDLGDYRWHYVEVVSESVCLDGEVGESASWQRVHYFEIKLRTVVPSSPGRAPAEHDREQHDE